MMRTLKKAAVALVALVLTAVLLPGCGGGSKGATVTIGEIIDLTGPGSPAMRNLHLALQDVIRYFNDEGLIPGVKIKLVSYDDMANPSRAIPGYEWVRERGAKAVVVGYADMSEILKPFAERDEVPLFAQANTRSLLEDPGWLFGLNAPTDLEIMTLLKWISANDWDYDTEGIPRVGFASWSTVEGIATDKAISEYCQAHPDEFDYVAQVFAPQGTMDWTGSVGELKGCDYVYCQGAALAGGAVIKEFAGRGYHTTFIGDSGQASFERFLVDMCGWEALDGLLSTCPAGWWTQPSQVINVAKELLQKYRSAQAEDIMAAGNTYQGGMQASYVVLEILRDAIAEVGAENIDGQAIYNAAIKYKTEGTIWEGRPQSGYTETHRYIVGAVEVYEWSAANEDLVRVADWQTLVEQP
jgi:ABC-type branched-subunit amino acid transport system substrate-binding protein